MRTTAIPANVSDNLEFSFLPKYNSSRYYVYMYFAEIQKLQENQIREFNIFVNGKLLRSEVNPFYLQNLYYYSSAISETKLELWLNKTSRSTLPPLFNAVEIYMEKDFLQSETYQTDGMYYYLVRYTDFTLKFLFTVNSRPCTSLFTCIILTILSC